MRTESITWCIAVILRIVLHPNAGITVQYSERRPMSKPNETCGCIGYISISANMDSPVEAEINNFACRYPTLKHDHDLLCTCVNGDMEELACLSTCTEEEHDSECPKTNFAAAWIALKAERDKLQAEIGMAKEYGGVS